jgi:hypothetical protein
MHHSSRLSIADLKKISRAEHDFAMSINTREVSVAVNQTLKALELAPNVIFDATFEKFGIIARVDILEIKSEYVSLTYLKPTALVNDDDIVDAAIYAWIMGFDGISANEIYIRHLNPHCDRLEGVNFFVDIDVTSRVLMLAKHVPAFIRFFDSDKLY